MRQALLKRDLFTIGIIVMLIGLIDADLLDIGTNFPNLALMKLSSFHKSEKDNVKLIDYNDIILCYEVYISKVFDFTSKEY